VASLDSQIDALYQQPLAGFTAARNALAKTLSGADAARVKKLPKPTVVPWAVNQLYWHARSAFDRLRASGEKLRTAQIAALKGKSADVRAALEAQRKAIADAVQQATALAGDSGSQPNADELTRTLEALSLAPELPETPGRLTRALQPAGFEALAGVPIRAKPETPAGPAKAGHRPHAAPTGPALREPHRDDRRDRERERARLEAQRRAQAELRRAEAALDRSKAAEVQARSAWERAKDHVQEAERAVAAARKTLED
jgi:hypothetical protein